MTLGLAPGRHRPASVGPAYFKDSKVVLSVLMWVVYLILVYTRWNSVAGDARPIWRLWCFTVAVVPGANYFSAVQDLYSHDAQLIGINTKRRRRSRERLAIPSAPTRGHQLLAQHPGIQEGLIISTCNRVELLTSAPGGVDLRGFCTNTSRHPIDFEPHLYDSARGKRFVIFSACVESRFDVVGEPQILGQVKDAYTIARGVGSVQSNLIPDFPCLCCGKKVRTETAVAVRPSPSPRLPSNSPKDLWLVTGRACILSALAR